MTTLYIPKKKTPACSATTLALRDVQLSTIDYVYVLNRLFPR
jgi:hypothetical protein